MRTMTKDEAYRFLASGTRTGKVATIKADGRAHVVPVWFVVDGDDLVFNTWHESAKAKHLRRDPRVSLVVDMEEPPYAYVMVEGSASISEDPAELRRAATMIGGRYMGADRAEEYGARNGVEGELVIRLTPEKILAFDDIAG